MLGSKKVRKSVDLFTQCFFLFWVNAFFFLTSSFINKKLDMDIIFYESKFLNVFKKLQIGNYEVTHPD